MAAQAKPSVLCDSVPTPSLAAGSAICACAPKNTGAIPGEKTDAATGGSHPDGSAAFVRREEGTGSAAGDRNRLGDGIFAAGERAAHPAAGLPLGLYVHVPFCSSTCDFCAFYQEKPRRDQIDLYLKAVAAELRAVRREIALGLPWLWQGEAGVVEPFPAGFTVFFGGGTPGLLAAKDLEQLCTLVREALEGFGPILEWSIELAPSTVKAGKVKVLLEQGVTRFSLGVQSFSERLLDALGRQHNPKQIFAAYETLRSGGAANVNCDLMFALPGQSREDWLADLEQMRALDPEHISTYCLTFEEDTALWVKLSQGRCKLDPENEAALYRETWRWLDAAGYRQYEVSNFAKDGFRSRHNLATWQMGRWRGIGPSAASQWGGWRFQNIANLGQWAQAVLAKEEANAGVPEGVVAHAVPAAKVLSSEARQNTASLDGRQFAPSGCQYSGMQQSTVSAHPAADAIRPPEGSEQHVPLNNTLLAADALIFGLRRRDGVNRVQWLRRFGFDSIGDAAADMQQAAADASRIEADAPWAGGAEAIMLARVEALFGRLAQEGLLDAGSTDCWRLTDEGLLVADAVGSEVLLCFETDDASAAG